MDYKFKVNLVLGALVVLCASFALASEQLSEPSGRVAKVGNITITKTDVDIRAQELMPMQVSFHGSIDAEKIAVVKQEALEALIERAYKVQYAIDEEVSIDAIDFENEWKTKQIKKPWVAKASPDQLSLFRADLYLDLLADKAQTVAVDEKVSIASQEVSSYYSENESRYYRPKSFTASHVFVKVDPAANAKEQEEKQARAEELFKRAQAGEDFYNLAYYESDDRSRYVGGSLGSFHSGQTLPEFDAAIQAMKPGDISNPVRTMYGFHVIKLDSVEVERQLEFEEVEAKIRADLEESERERLYGKWMADLKEKYPSERFDQ